MNKKEIKKDLENTLGLINKFDYDLVYSKLSSDFELRMKKSDNTDEYLMYLAKKMLEFARKDDPSKNLFLKGHKILRRLAHKIYRDYNDGRSKEGFLTLI